MSEWTHARLGAALALVLLGALCALVGSRWGQTRGRRRRARRALAAQAEAETLLEDRGYVLLEREPRIRWTMRVDRVAHEVGLRADLLVSRGRRVYVADVKTGGVAPDPTACGTRRQLLEYALAYRADGVLLVDMETRQLHEVAFALGPQVIRGAVLPWLATGALAGALASAAAYAVLAR